VPADATGAAMTGTATGSGAQVVTAQAGTGSIAHDAEDAAALGAIQGANPFVGLTPGQLARAAARWAGALGRHPTVLVSEVLKWGSEEARVLAGASSVRPDPKDKRFADPA